jgi:GNAT superfamily N-acetyltransferase
MNIENFVIQKMSIEELKMTLDWANIEGWNPGLNDAECYYSADENGFLIGYLDGKPIATISVVKYGLSFGFLGFYMVDPEYRGKGFGIQIWNAGIKYLEGRNIGLDGVVDQQDNYLKSGFKLAYRNVRFEGTGGLIKAGVENNIVNLSDISFDKLAKYDRDFFPEERCEFLKKWINQPFSFAKAFVREDKIEAYGVIRKCRTGYKIGPLYADSYENAEKIFLALISEVSTNEAVFLDVPELNNEAVFLAQKYNMKMMFETARMYTAEMPNLPMKKIFGVTSFEIG